MSRSDLSRREREVVECASRGLTDKQTGIELGVAPGTIHTHWARIFAKLKARSRAEAVAWVKSSGSENDVVSKPLGSGFAVCDAGSALKTDQLSHEQILRDLPCVVLLLDAHTLSIRAAFGRTLHAFGARPPELVERSGEFGEGIVHPDHLKAAKACVNKALTAPGEVAGCVVRTHPSTGAWQWMDCQMAAIALGGGAASALVVTLRDVSRQVAELSAARETAARATNRATLLSAAWELLPVGLVVFDPRRRVRRANALAVKLLGSSKGAAAEPAIRLKADDVLQGPPGQIRRMGVCSLVWHPLHSPVGSLLGYMAAIFPEQGEMPAQEAE
jgi:DNA-binding CsgD family transcriptional regulator